MPFYSWTMPQYSEQELADYKLVREASSVFNEFRDWYDKINSASYREGVYRTGDAALIADYERLRSRAESVKTLVKNVTGAWDQIKGWFRSVTGSGQLGAVQIPAALALGGAAAATAAIVASIKAFDRRYHVTRMMREQGMTRDQALATYSSSAGLSTIDRLFNVATMTAILGVAGLAFLLTRR